MWIGLEVQTLNMTLSAHVVALLLSFKNRMAGDEKHDGYHLSYCRDVSMDSTTTLVNLSPTKIRTTAISDRYSKDVEIVDGIRLSVLGQRNRVKLVATGQYPNGQDVPHVQKAHGLANH